MEICSFKVFTEVWVLSLFCGPSETTNMIFGTNLLRKFHPWVWLTQEPIKMQDRRNLMLWLVFVLTKPRVKLPHCDEEIHPNDSPAKNFIFLPDLCDKKYSFIHRCFKYLHLTIEDLTLTMFKTTRRNFILQQLIRLHYLWIGEHSLSSCWHCCWRLENLLSSPVRRYALCSVMSNSSALRRWILLLILECPGSNQSSERSEGTSAILLITRIANWLKEFLGWGIFVFKFLRLPKSFFLLKYNIFFYLQNWLRIGSCCLKTFCP